MDFFIIYYVILIVVTFFYKGSITTMEIIITGVASVFIALVGVIITSRKERKEIQNLENYLKDDIKEYLNNEINKKVSQTNEISKYSIDPNVIKILENVNYIKEDTKTKNLLSEEYKGKINRNLMVANVEATYDKIVDLEIENNEIKTKFNSLIEENNKLIKENNILEEKLKEEIHLKENQNQSLNNEISFLRNENRKLNHEIKELENKLKNKRIDNPNIDKGFSR